MILAGTRPPVYVELRERARRAADAAAAEQDDRAPEVDVRPVSPPVRSAVEIGPRPPSD